MRRYPIFMGTKTTVNHIALQCLATLTKINYFENSLFVLSMKLYRFHVAVGRTYKMRNAYVLSKHLDIMNSAP